MPVQQPLQPEACITEFEQQALHLLRRFLEIGGTQRWLPTKLASIHAGYSSNEGFVEWAATVGIQPIRRGRSLLWDRLDIDSTLERLKGHAGSLAPLNGRRHGSDFTSRDDS